MLLQDVSVSQSSDRSFVISADTEDVVLRAKWGSTAPGKMTEFDGLVHHFASPSIEQQRLYNRAMSETRIVQDGKGAVRTIYPMRQELLLALYDGCIRGVDGYCAGGSPLQSVEEIQRNMDAMHKITAVQNLFAGIVSEAA